MDGSALFNNLNSIAASIELPEGSLLFQFGDRVEGVYLVYQGNVAVKWGCDMNRSLMETLGPGDIIGLAASLNGRYSATAHVTEDSVVGFIPVDRMTLFLECCPDLTRAVAELIAFRLLQLKAATLAGSRVTFDHE